MKTAILWLRNDLRLHDHEALIQAIDAADEVIPVYFLDPRHFAQTRWFGFPKTGAYRARFLLESLHDLREQFRAAGSDLLVRSGKPEEILPALCSQYDAMGVFAHEEVTDEEKYVESEVEDALSNIGVALNCYWGATLFHLNDLPMGIERLPEVFTDFRKRAEKYSDIRPEFDRPSEIASPFIEDAGDIPALEELGLLWPEEASDRGVLPFQGGETAALGRLYDYFWEGNHLKDYKETRNGLLGADYSSKFSAWLALGCLSPRRIYEEVQRYENIRVKNRSTYWMIFELIWRDYFRFVCKKHGKVVFFKTGIKGVSDKQMDVDWKKFEAWKTGNTRSDFVNANMKELLQTGFMSNRGRQNVASYLVNDLKLDWRMGAEWFESVLVDYDVCSNWGNWNYVAGVGNDPREGRYFNVQRQAERYDPDGEYVRYWLK
ncbi:MAG: DASH family cryptochrome [Bacteroidia bacterium]